MGFSVTLLGDLRSGRFADENGIMQTRYVPVTAEVKDKGVTIYAAIQTNNGTLNIVMTGTVGSENLSPASTGARPSAAGCMSAQ